MEKYKKIEVTKFRRLRQRGWRIEFWWVRQTQKSRRETKVGPVAVKYEQGSSCCGTGWQVLAGMSLFQSQTQKPKQSERADNLQQVTQVQRAAATAFSLLRLERRFWAWRALRQSGRVGEVIERAAFLWAHFNRGVTHCLDCAHAELPPTYWYSPRQGGTGSCRRFFSAWANEEQKTLRTEKVYCNSRGKYTLFYFWNESSASCITWGKRDLTAISRAHKRSLTIETQVSKSCSDFTAVHTVLV